MRAKRAKQIKRIMRFLGHGDGIDKQGNRVTNQYRRFKKIYTKNRKQTLKLLDQMDVMRSKALAQEAIARAEKEQEVQVAPV